MVDRSRKTMATRVRLTCLTIAFGFLFCLVYIITTYHASDFRSVFYDLKSSPISKDNLIWKYRINTEVSTITESTYKRSRIVTNIGEILPDEQSDLNDIRVLSIINNNKKRHTKPTFLVKPTLEKLQNQSSENGSYHLPVGIIESDPKIDDNVIPISYKFYVDKNNIRLVHKYISHFNVIRKLVISNPMAPFSIWRWH